MVLNLRSETAKSYDISQHLHEIHESVRLAFLNSFLDFAGMDFLCNVTTEGLTNFVSNCCIIHY
jgi:hypothetical protein